MTLKGGTSQACAACKYQRRKCTVECPLAPYFPPDQPKLFQNAHKLFGVSNILKILKNLEPNQKAEAMRSIIYQSNIRDKFPVHGCWEVICLLRYQIQMVEEELHSVHSQLEMYRHHQLSSVPEDDVTSQLELGMGLTNNGLQLFNHASSHPQPYATASLPESQFQNVAYSCAAYLDSKDYFASNMWVQNLNANNITFSSNTVANQVNLVKNNDEMQPFFDTIDDRYSCIDSKEAYETSSESSMRDTTLFIEHVGENELKNAAACFSLTSPN